MDPPIDDELLEKVRQFVESQMGYRELEFNQALLPTEFHCIADLARQFGIGDDGTRPEAMALMPIEFVRESADRVASIEPALSQWLGEGEWTAERNAIFCLKDALEHRLWQLESGKPAGPTKPLSVNDLGAVFDQARAALPRKR